MRWTSGGDGFTTPASYTNMGTFFASITPLSVEELIAAQAQEAVATHTINCRWFGVVNEKDKFTYTRYYPDGTTSTATLEIISIIDEDERHRELTILAKEAR